MFDLRDKHIVISGAGGGIGRSLVAAFLAAGARVTACDRDAALLARLEGVRTSLFELTDRETTTRAIEDIIVSAGPPDVVVANAGFSRADVMGDLSPAIWDSEIESNLTGAYNFVAPFLPAMMEAGGGSVVVISSVNGLAHFGNPAYSAAKAGLLAYVRSLAVELGRRGIRANAVCPGSVRTPAWDHRIEKDPALFQEVVRHYPLGRLVEPAEVANTVLFLASRLSAGITGTAIPVDAGLTAGNLRFVTDILNG